MLRQHEHRFRIKRAIYFFDCNLPPLMIGTSYADSVRDEQLSSQNDSTCITAYLLTQEWSFNEFRQFRGLSITWNIMYTYAYEATLVNVFGCWPSISPSETKLC